MLTVDEALELIVSEVRPREPEEILLRDARGLVLATDIISPLDSPPFDKSLMDGFAVRAEDVSRESATLRIIEELTAGRVSERRVGPGEAVRIMTGAPLPPGTDAVVPIERTDLREGSPSVTISGPVSAEANLVRRGESVRQGEAVLRAGTCLRAPQLGVLAELGCGWPKVFPRPSVGVLATGDELVPIDQNPVAGQIRNSNETMLLAQAEQAGARALGLGIARDDRESLAAKIDWGLRCDVLCLSGGVSAGKLDLVPSVLQAAGVREVFHKVQIKPGKPVWFGILEGDRTSEGRPRCIFGLPGNPVSSMVCFELFVRTALRRLMGITPVLPQGLTARLEVDHAARGDRPTYFPARLERREEGPVVRPVDWRGSFDLRATAAANSMILFPAGERVCAGGENVTVYEWT